MKERDCDRIVLAAAPAPTASARSGRARNTNGDAVREGPVFFTRRSISAPVIALLGFTLVLAAQHVLQASRSVPQKQRLA